MIICHILVPIQIIHNILFNLTKRIIISVSNQEKVEKHLNELQHFLLSCKNHEHVIGRGFFNAKLQGSAPKRNVVTTYYSNTDNNTLIKKICKFRRHVFSCVIKNNCLQEQFFKFDMMLRLNNSDKLKTLEKHFHLKGFDTLNNPNRTSN